MMAVLAGAAALHGYLSNEEDPGLRLGAPSHEYLGNGESAGVVVGLSKPGAGR